MEHRHAQQQRQFRQTYGTQARTTTETVQTDLWKQTHTTTEIVQTDLWKQTHTTTEMQTHTNRRETNDHKTRRKKQEVTGRGMHALQQIHFPLPPSSERLRDPDLLRQLYITARRRSSLRVEAW